MDERVYFNFTGNAEVEATIKADPVRLMTEWIESDPEDIEDYESFAEWCEYRLADEAFDYAEIVDCSEGMFLDHDKFPIDDTRFFEFMKNTTGQSFHVIGQLDIFGNEITQLTRIPERIEL